jgi:myosin regulatory light chain 12
MFEPSQVKQFKEAFAVIDQDGDGRVSKEDLRIMLSSLGESAQARLIPGQTPTPNLLETLLTDPSGKRVETINFTQFLSMMGQHLLQLDAEQDLLEAFASFDDEDKGWVKVDDVRKALQEMGDRMNAQEVCMYCVNRADPD